MAVTVTMHKDLRKKKDKFIGPFSWREFLCILLGLIPGYIIFRFIAIEDIGVRVLIAFVSGFPIMLCGFLKKDGQYFETLFARYIYKMFLTPTIRKKKLTMYTALRKKADAEALKSKLNKMSSKDRKKYLRSHKNGAKPMNYKVSKPGNKMYR